MSVVDLLREAPARGDAAALIEGSRRWSYAELEGAVQARADALRGTGGEVGIVAGRVAPLVMQADAAGVIELLALWRLGATPAPLNAKLTDPERNTAQGALLGARADVQAILWTSGTAGRARGVAISYEALRASARAAARRLDLGANDVWLASLSPAHVGGLALITRSILLGGTLATIGAFDAVRALDALRGLRVTHASVVPTQLLRLLEASGDAPPPPSFRCALVGGADAPSSLLARAQAAGWPLALTYGLSEATSQVATAPPDLTRSKPGTVGKPLDGVELRISEDGEILVRGATLAESYVGRGVGSIVDLEGWHHTGDLGRIDEDGDLWVIGRRVDRIVSGGVTVDAVEVEEVLRAHEQVADACVVGVQDAEWGEVVAAWVEPAGERLDLDGLDGFMRARLTAAKVPRRYHVGGPPPRNANGKVDRSAVRAALTQSAEGTPNAG